MARLLWASLAVAFLILGLRTALGADMALVRYGDLALLFGIILGIGASTLGIILLIGFAYSITCDPAGLTMRLVLAE